jgi:hypothetical protein
MPHVDSLNDWQKQDLHFQDCAQSPRLISALPANCPTDHFNLPEAFHPLRAQQLSEAGCCPLYTCTATAKADLIAAS